MELRTNEGYIITDSIHIGECEFVLGVNQHPNALVKYVTWECKEKDNYFWGHYFKDDLFKAQKDLVERAQQQIRIIENLRGIDDADKKKDKETER